MQSIQVRQESCDIEPFISKPRTSHNSTAITDVTLGLSFERFMHFFRRMSVKCLPRYKKIVYSISFLFIIPSHHSNLCVRVCVFSQN
ncbi:MAG: hypothetical protein ACI8RD_005931 [Bacillariaceae sp.]|jgi:hypothetical protein